MMNMVSKGKDVKLVIETPNGEVEIEGDFAEHSVDTIDSYEFKYDLVKGEIDKLADFLISKYPEEIGKGDYLYGESAVDVAIRLLSK
jgi:hypothetical protein